MTTILFFQQNEDDMDVDDADDHRAKLLNKDRCPSSTIKYTGLAKTTYSQCLDVLTICCLYDENVLYIIKVKFRIQPKTSRKP